MSNFDFGGYINDENKFEEEFLTEAEEDSLSPYGILCAKLGRPRARSIFDTLKRIATRVSAEKGGTPAIIFNDKGGEFVAILSDN